MQLRRPQEQWRPAPGTSHLECATRSLGEHPPLTPSPLQREDPWLDFHHYHGLKTPCREDSLVTQVLLTNACKWHCQNIAADIFITRDGTKKITQLTTANQKVQTISRGSVATCLKCDKIFSDYSIANAVVYHAEKILKLVTTSQVTCNGTVAPSLIHRV